MTTDEELETEIEKRDKANKYYVEKIANINEDTDYKWRSKRKELWDKEGFKICKEVQEIPELKAELKGRKDKEKEMLDDEIAFLEKVIIAGRSLEKYEDAYMEIKSRIEERLQKLKGDEKYES